MKILFFIECLDSGGKERRLVELIKSFKNVPEIDCQLVLTKKQIHYRDILTTGIVIHYIERKNFRKDPRLFFTFFKICLKFQPDIIHVWENMVALYAIPAKIILNIPMINSQITDAFAIMSCGSLLRNKIAFHFSNLIISNSKAGLMAYNPPKNKSMVVYNGFNFERIHNITGKTEIRNKYHIQTTYVVGMVATFSENKDYETYIKAAHIVLGKKKDITFLCIGSGDFSFFQNMIMPEYRENIKILGKQTNIESIINICDFGVLVTNQNTHAEGISNALLEFMAFRKPVIATDNGGTKELVLDAQTGFLIPPSSPETLAAKILFLLAHPDISVTFGTNGLKIIHEKFNIDKMTNAYLNHYSNIVKKK